MPARKSHGPTVKDDGRYEALRGEGMSKEKATRIANSDAHQVGREGGKAQAYEEWTKSALYDKAEHVGIDGRSKLDKQGLIDALREH